MKAKDKIAPDPLDLLLARSNQRKMLEERGEIEQAGAQVAPESGQPVSTSQPEPELRDESKSKPIVIEVPISPWKTSINVPKRHENIVNEFVNHYRMKGLRPVSANTIFLAAVEVLERSPALDEAVEGIVSNDRRRHRNVAK
jgi:hypothetical protein